VITSAALIMISVFLGFVLSDDPTPRCSASGLATAIFIDATIVRIVLVPAAHDAPRRRQLWLPRWLERVLADHRRRHTAGHPDAERQPIRRPNSASRQRRRAAPAQGCTRCRTRDGPCRPDRRVREQSTP
jgi:RND superfamily putative drug exporter